MRRRPASLQVFGHGTIVRLFKLNLRVDAVYPPHNTSQAFEVLRTVSKNAQLHLSEGTRISGEAIVRSTIAFTSTAPQ
jgi:hypothetical protein